MKSVAGTNTYDDLHFAYPNKHAEPVTFVDEYFPSEVIRKGPAARDVSGSILIQQAEFYHHVWKRILEDTNVRLVYINGIIWSVRYVHAWSYFRSL